MILITTRDVSVKCRDCLSTGIEEVKLAEEVSKRLQQVRLTDSAKSVSSSFSGGMKRRLSVAISFIGDPELVFLDEPTTGACVTCDV